MLDDHNLHSEYSKELEEDWESGHLKDIADAAIVFFKQRIHEFHIFIEEMKSKHVKLDLEMYAKLFIFRFNMPFDMEHYMMRQSKFINRKISDSCKNIEKGSTEKQRLVAKWIKEYAADHRHKEILRQIFCVRKIKDTFLPQLAKILEEHREKLNHKS